MKPAQVQSCGYAGIYTQPLLAMGGVRMKARSHTPMLTAILFTA